MKSNFSVELRIHTALTKNFSGSLPMIGEFRFAKSFSTLLSPFVKIVDWKLLYARVNLYLVDI